VRWRLVYTRQAKKDAKKLAASGLKGKAQALLKILSKDPYRSPPPYERLVGDLKGGISRRTNIQYRLIYQVLQDYHIVKVIRMWSHYE
jgi:Txe/YoeB family toxin of toxin-antitoxin system